MDMSNLLYGCNVSKSECHFYNVFVLCSALMSLLTCMGHFLWYTHIFVIQSWYFVCLDTRFITISDIGKHYWKWHSLCLGLIEIDCLEVGNWYLILSLITKELSYNFLSDKNVLRHWFCHGYNKKMQAVITKHLVNTGLWWIWHFMYQDLKTSYSSDLNDILKQLVSLWCVCVLDPSHIIETGIQWLYAPNLNQENCQHCIAA